MLIKEMAEIVSQGLSLRKVSDFNLNINKNNTLEGGHIILSEYVMSYCY